MKNIIYSLFAIMMIALGMGAATPASALTCFVEGSVSGDINNISGGGVTVGQNGIAVSPGLGCKFINIGNFNIGALARVEWEKTSNVPFNDTLAATLGYQLQKDIEIYGLAGLHGLTVTPGNSGGSVQHTGLIAGAGLDLMVFDRTHLGLEYDYTVQTSKYWPSTATEETPRGSTIRALVRYDFNLFN